MADRADHISCGDFVELVTDYLEGTMSPHETAVFEQHLNMCEGCVIYLDHMRATLNTVGRLREDDVPAEARDRLLATFRSFKR